MSGFAAAKINLHLHVTGRRPDGYHLLDSLVMFADIGDVVEAVPGDGLSLVVDGPFAAGLGGEADNLVLRAARRLAALAGVTPNAALRLTKWLPVASGIGGGSADAAAALRVLCGLWGVAPELSALAAALGADVPACLASRPALLGGVGETLQEVPALPEFGLLLVNPGVAVPTPAVFAAREAGSTPACRLPAAWPDLDAFIGWLTPLRNDLEAPARRLCPQIGAVLAAIGDLEGCRLARMSGSGATCFGLFETPEAARQAAGQLNRQEWWIREGQSFTLNPK